MNEKIWAIQVPDPPDESVKSVWDRYGFEWQVRIEPHVIVWLEQYGGQAMTWYELITHYGPLYGSFELWSKNARH